MQSFALKQGIYHFYKKDKNMARSIVKCAIRSFVLNNSINLLPKSTNFVRCISSTCTRFVGKFLNMFQLKSFYRIFLLSFFKIILSLKYLSGKVKIENNYRKVWLLTVGLFAIAMLCNPCINIEQGRIHSYCT